MNQAPSKNKGFTLAEIVVVLAVFVVILVGLLALYDSFYKIYNSQATTVTTASSAAEAANELQTIALQADQVMSSYNFSGTSYGTNANTLVLELPATDSSGNIIAGKYDYAVFYVSGTKLFKLVQTDPASSRQSGLKLLSDSVTSLTFTYNSPMTATVNEIDMVLITTSTSAHQTSSYKLHQEIYLRNH